MISIWITKEKKHIRIRMNGHAGFAEPGQDIVCAGASMLFYTLAEAEGNAAELISIRAGGDSEIVFRDTRKSRTRLGMFRDGAGLLIRNYPECVRWGENPPGAAI